MTRLTKALASWGSPAFKPILKQELENLDRGVLPLHQAIQLGGQVDDSDISVLVNAASDNDCSIEVQVGIFFYEIMGGCSCGDEPTRENSYCELLVAIDKTTAAASFIPRVS